MPQATMVGIDCERASLVVWGDLETQGEGGPFGVPGGAGVRNLTSGFKSTACKL
jgi:hypothetical protein